MPTFGGCAFDYSKPTPVNSADFFRARLVVRYGRRVALPMSADGFRCDGHYGRHRTERRPCTAMTGRTTA
jgi:hypothetical protein